jgi:hypothetical protein
MTKVICNASPLINLARIRKLPLLHDLYGELTIPQAVWQEVVVDGHGQPGADDVARATWISVQTVANSTLVQALRQELDAGEAEAIALTLEIQEPLLLMDERLGRETAKHLNIPYIGLVGILVLAKKKGLIPATKPFLDKLRDVAGFRVSERLYMRVLRDEGEI